MPIKVLINGAFGRMGQISVKTIKENPKFELAGQIGREYDLAKSIKDSGAQVVVDFTHPESAFANAMTIIEAGAHPIIGTSGLSQEQVNSLAQKCDAKKLGGMVVPNFSIGAILMMRYAKEIAKYMPHVEIIEMHHDEKADSPSGTAIRTAEMLAEAGQMNQPLKPSKEIKPGARGANYLSIPIHAVRLPGFLAHQQIIFGSTGETLTLRHDSIGRECFMPGLVLACEKVMGLDRMVYGLDKRLFKLRHCSPCGLSNPAFKTGLLRYARNDITKLLERILFNIIIHTFRLFLYRFSFSFRFLLLIKQAHILFNRTRKITPFYFACQVRCEKA